MTRDRRPNEWGMTGDRAKVNVATTGGHAELYNPPRQDKTPMLGLASGNRLRGF
jgi:hypothetical protein